MIGSKREDWHAADIIAAVKKSGTSLAALSRQNGLSSGTLANALKRPWAKGEWIIAAQVGVPPATIWPQRYFDANGRPLNRRPGRRKKTLDPAL
ncbi:transcriptional regulator [Erwinia sp. E602]|uniref:helix-turn-helix domain-containing protein n=1 Tax=Erwinia sp. E602 TaxID=2675378 RepID=UPI001BAC5929|nr:helix-turn-helix transcriptional regulator [Erwinia sp. E602]QUG77374.1 transcriptional regulator [Erwinia sp. E602]